jgi:hypothetical protein
LIKLQSRQNRLRVSDPVVQEAGVCNIALLLAGEIVIDSAQFLHHRLQSEGPECFIWGLFQAGATLPGVGSLEARRLGGSALVPTRQERSNSTVAAHFLQLRAQTLDE